MKITVYKGFDKEFLSNVSIPSLTEAMLDDKLNVFGFNRATKKELLLSLYSLEDKDSVWMTYEEYSLVQDTIDSIIQDDGLQVIIEKNNLYPEYYPIPYEIGDEVADEILTIQETASFNVGGIECQKFGEIYSSLLNINGKYYGCFNNREVEKSSYITVQNHYPATITVNEGELHDNDFVIHISDDVETYLHDFENVLIRNPKRIGVYSEDDYRTQSILNSLKAYCQKFGIELFKYHESISSKYTKESELIEIAQNDIKIPNFQQFRNIRFYKSPDINNETIEISQSRIIQDIIEQAENSYESDKFRDIFITASTGAGKSVMFQVPAVYLAKKHNKMTIIIEPVKALMQDQKEALISRGYMRVEAFNSDLITQTEKENALKRIKNGEIDLLYLSPETLLSYSIETIIGDREIGLLIVDEAHIVTTWGIGFRPDYWYLGGYLNRLRNRVQLARGKNRKVYKFPICTFTATAIYGGIDNTIGETITSLYMRNPIKYIGYVKRDDIKFDINIKQTEKMPTAEYELEKGRLLGDRIQRWIENKEKTIVYFPYASYAYNAYYGYDGFGENTIDHDHIGIYTGRNIDDISAEAFSETKKETFEKFKKGDLTVMFATKAFGMGVDIDDVKNVYHYAVSGNMNDYLQEIGRAARKKEMTGLAVLDDYYNDIKFTQTLFGMSQIKEYQVRQVLSGILRAYNSHKSRSTQNSKNFLISPESFAYIFSSKNENNSQSINKLKTTLLMLEKDLQNIYTFKVLISRPQSVFTKAYVVIDHNNVNRVLNSEFGTYFKFVEHGRYDEKLPDGSMISDLGDVYSIELKEIWEKKYRNMSFPAFKYWYFNYSSPSKDNPCIMKSIRKYIYPRQKVTIETQKDYVISELRNRILADFDYIADEMYKEFGYGKFFSIDEFRNLISRRFGSTKARLIANSVIDIVDPKHECIKNRLQESTTITKYTITNGNFKEYLRKSITGSSLINYFQKVDSHEVSKYISIDDDSNNTALKLLSLFGYITYEALGGEEPEIFIRLNDPKKIEGIVNGRIRYSNYYVKRAKEKHDRDVRVLDKFFHELNNDDERWNYIEQYFLGYDVLKSDEVIEEKKASLNSMIDKLSSSQTNDISTWKEMYQYFDAVDHSLLDELSKNNLPLPEYTSTVLKKTNVGNDILMCWPSHDVLIFTEDVSDKTLAYCQQKGWLAYTRYNVDYSHLVEVFK